MTSATGLWDRNRVETGVRSVETADGKATSADVVPVSLEGEGWVDGSER